MVGDGRPWDFGPHFTEFDSLLPCLILIGGAMTWLDEFVASRLAPGEYLSERVRLTGGALRAIIALPPPEDRLEERLFSIFEALRWKKGLDTATKQR